ncbi:MAG: metallophosphoesterase [Clostridiales bacterium]|nr:metallophosphoesterase [Clostridiales bacterium]
MRILVVSDSHSDRASLRMALASINAEAYIFLGDGYRDWESLIPYMNCQRLIAVKGNNDWGCEYPLSLTERIGGKLIYCTHGHSVGVQFNLLGLEDKAREAGADIALYGHTHEPNVTYKDGLYMMNPGSVRKNSCGIIDITPKGIMCFTRKIVSYKP